MRWRYRHITARHGVCRVPTDARLEQLQAAGWHACRRLHILYKDQRAWDSTLFRKRLFARDTARGRHHSPPVPLPDKPVASGSGLNTFPANFPWHLLLPFVSQLDSCVIVGDLLPDVGVP